MGGNVGLRGFRERVYQDVRSLIADDYELNINASTEENPSELAWQGGKLLANSNDEFNDLVVTRKAYDEFGHNLCRKKFDISH